MPDPEKGTRATVIIPDPKYLAMVVMYLGHGSVVFAPSIYQQLFIHCEN